MGKILVEHNNIQHAFTSEKPLFFPCFDEFSIFLREKILLKALEIDPESPAILKDLKFIIPITEDYDFLCQYLEGSLFLDECAKPFCTQSTKDFLHIKDLLDQMEIISEIEIPLGTAESSEILESLKKNILFLVHPHHPLSFAEFKDLLEKLENENINANFSGVNLGKFGLCPTKIKVSEAELEHAYCNGNLECLRGLEVILIDRINNFFEAANFQRLAGEFGFTLRFA